MTRYYYLVYSLCFLAIALIMLAYRKDLRTKSLSALIWGAFCGPAIEILHYKDYWRPHTLLGTGRISIEDALFGASICAIAFLTYPVVARQTLSESRLSSNQQLKRIVAYVVGAIVLFVLLIGVLRVNSVFATALILMVGWLSQVRQRRDLLRPSLSVAVIFISGAIIVYGIGVSVVGLQELKNTWLLYDSSAGLLLCGKIPVSELIWFFAAGAFLSVFDLYTSGKHYLESGGRPSNVARNSSTAGTHDKA